jgi:hypothetical protein
VAVYLFIGVASGYAAAVIVHYVIFPKFIALPVNDPYQLTLAIIPWLLGISVLFTKPLPRISWIGNFAMALLVGIGAAAAIGGALLGTVIPQFQASISPFDLRAAGDLGTRLGRFGEGVVMLLGTSFTLAAFHFSAGRAADGTPKRPGLLEMAAWVGRIFIAITLGVLFAGVYMAALTAMIERLSSIINFIRQLIGI